MKSIRNLAKEKKVLFSIWGLLVFVAILNLFNFSFISDRVQYGYYVVYFIMTFIVFISIKKKSDFRVSQLLIALITLLTLVLSIKDIFLAMPIFLLYPLLSCRKSHWRSMILAASTYFIAILGIMLILFIGYGFGSTTLIEQNKSPDSNHQISMYLVDGGATGGNTLIYLDRLYLNTFKHRKRVFVGGFGADNKLMWIDDKTFAIDEHIININTTETIWE
ncbi:DUF5412 family protein [Tissierella sp.]|uniref:DUF5412 family protein n=1 Tax=Tissierella sp. TaxID=41274 RepID=UPI00285E1A56|nr:DUF5412 family protein [Tissierella sp.]MDR7855411.1 DUF5412 family protein [Tissierella sp.]